LKQAGEQKEFWAELDKSTRKTIYEFLGCCKVIWIKELTAEFELKFIGTLKFQTKVLSLFKK
jgi:hypothetical protein